MILRRLDPRDAPAAVALAAERGFATDEREWLLAASLGPGLCLDAPGGELAGIALACPQGARVAGVVALVVAARHAGRGLGRRLAEGLADACPGMTLLLHAPAGSVAALERAGFRAAGDVARHGGALAAADEEEEEGVRLRPMGGADLPGVVALDEIACGAPRRTLLERLLPASERVCVAIDGSRLVGYGVAWPRAGEIAVGPIVAETPATAATLAAFLAAGHSRPVRLWIPEGSALAPWAAAHGLPADGGATILVRGGDLPPPGRARVHALAAPGLG